MYILTFDTFEQAEAYSRNEAAKRIQNHTTELLWGVMQSEYGFVLVVPEDTKDAVEVPDDYKIWNPVTSEDSSVIQEINYQISKSRRNELVSKIKVTTASNKTFDGDEVSQTRMSRAIIALQLSNQLSTTWVLADNTACEVTLNELAEALALAGEEQTRLWVST